LILVHPCTLKGKEDFWKYQKRNELRIFFHHLKPRIIERCKAEKILKGIGFKEDVKWKRSKEFDFSSPLHPKGKEIFWKFQKIIEFRIFLTPFSPEWSGGVRRKKSNVKGFCFTTAFGLTFRVQGLQLKSTLNVKHWALNVELTLLRINTKLYKLRVLQIIDSLRPGGAEKMAVTYANALVGQVEGSYLCCSRMEGMLKDSLMPEVEYLFLNKKSSLDLKAILKLRSFIKSRQISIVHAHSTSFFLAGCLKFTGLKFKLVWHDHYGESELLKERNHKVLKIFSGLFSGIISVNTKLKEWSEQHLECRNVVEIKNFIPATASEINSEIRLKGKEEDFKIICVANLRPQKDHLNLIQAFEHLSADLPGSLHLIGANFEDRYSESVLNAIKGSPASDRIFYYGEQSEISGLLAQANLGILASRSEGLPVALLEYGMAGLPVIVAEVGQCKQVIGEYGLLVPPNDPEALAEAITSYFKNPEKRKKNAFEFQQNIVKNYSEKLVLSKLTEFYKKL